MNSAFALLLAFGSGVVAGLRSLTAPAVVAWAAHIGWINLHGSPLAFMGAVWAVAIFTVLAVVELVADQLPTTPSRTAPIGLSARIVTGALTGAPERCGRAVPLARSAGRSDRWNCRRVCWQTRTCRTRSGFARTRFRNRNPGRPDRDRARTVFWFLDSEQHKRRLRASFGIAGSIKSGTCS